MQRGAKEYAGALVKDIAKQSPAIMLTPAQATDALAAFERLMRFRETTGRQLSLLGLGGCPPKFVSALPNEKSASGQQDRF